MEKEDIFISEKIRQLRILHKKSQEELGDFLNLPKQTISRIEKGERKVSHTELLKIADFLDEPVEAFTEEDIKYKLILRKYYAIALPKFAIDFLDDYRFLVNDQSSQNSLGLIQHIAVKDEIIRDINSIFDGKFRQEEMEEYAEKHNLY